uniref:(northern house mosquito) hypothetical protein n=1 Tax=Culex pipiens TaxID=7175 RepID=A0A8D8I6U4_CULPI
MLTTVEKLRWKYFFGMFGLPDHCSVTSTTYPRSRSMPTNTLHQCWTKPDMSTRTTTKSFSRNTPKQHGSCSIPCTNILAKRPADCSPKPALPASSTWWNYSWTAIMSWITTTKTNTRIPPSSD